MWYLIIPALIVAVAAPQILDWMKRHPLQGVPPKKYPIGTPVLVTYGGFLPQAGVVQSATFTADGWRYDVNTSTPLTPNSLSENIPEAGLTRVVI